MARIARGTASKSLLLVFCLSSGLALASPTPRAHVVQSGLWSEVERSFDEGIGWLRGFYLHIFRSARLMSGRL